MLDLISNLQWAFCTLLPVIALPSPCYMLSGEKEADNSQLWERILCRREHTKGPAFTTGLYLEEEILDLKFVSDAIM